MSVHLITELKRRIRENDSAKIQTPCTIANCPEVSARGNQCTTHYLVELSDKMSPIEYEEFKSEVCT